MAGGAGTRAVGPLGVCRAESFNYMMEGSEQAHRFRNLSALSGKEPPLAPCVIRVRNDTGADLDRYAVLGLDGPLIDPAIYEPDEFCRAVAFAGVTPRVQDIGRWCLTNDPLEAGAIGRAVLSGVSICRLRVNTEGDQWAECYPTERVWLDSRSGGGSAEVLWCEAGTGYKWAIVRFPRLGITPGIEYQLDDVVYNYERPEGWPFGKVVGGVQCSVLWKRTSGATEEDSGTQNLSAGADFDNPKIKLLKAGLWQFDVDCVVFTTDDANDWPAIYDLLGATGPEVPVCGSWNPPNSVSHTHHVYNQVETGFYNKLKGGLVYQTTGDGFEDLLVQNYIVIERGRAFPDENILQSLFCSRLVNVDTDNYLLNNCLKMVLGSFGAARLYNVMLRLQRL